MNQLIMRGPKRHTLPLQMPEGENIVRHSRTEIPPHLAPWPCGASSARQQRDLPRGVPYSWPREHELHSSGSPYLGRRPVSSAISPYLSSPNTYMRLFPLNSSVWFKQLAYDPFPHSPTHASTHAGALTVGKPFPRPHSLAYHDEFLALLCQLHRRA